jgi:hypothetical protein
LKEVATPLKEGEKNTWTTLGQFAYIYNFKTKMTMGLMLA